MLCLTTRTEVYARVNFRASGKVRSTGFERASDRFPSVGTDVCGDLPTLGKRFPSRSKPKAQKSRGEFETSPRPVRYVLTAWKFQGLGEVSHPLKTCAQTSPGRGETVGERDGERSALSGPTPPPELSN